MVALHDLDIGASDVGDVVGGVGAQPDAPQLLGRWEGHLSPVQSEGGLWGLLVGDAVGVPYEFHPPTSLPPSPQ